MSAAANYCPRIPIALVVVGELLLSGCKVGPNYKKPDISVENKWEHPATTQASVANEARPPMAWWTTLNDPELTSLVDRAADSNLTLSIAKTRIVEARAERSVAAGALLPSIGADAGYSFNRGTGPLFPAVTGDYPFYTAGFDAIWEADIFGGVRRSVEAAQDILQAQQDAERGAVVSVVSEVARNYVELRTVQQRIAITKENIQIQSETLDLAKRLNSAGIVSDIDVVRGQGELSQTQSEVAVLQIQEKASIYQLGVLLGASPQSLQAELQNPKPIPAPPSVVPIGLPSQLLRRRPDVRQAERQLAAATAQIGVAEADLYPQLTLTGDFGVGAEQFGNMFNWSSRYIGIGPSLRWQLFEGGRIVANIDAHKAIRQELLDQYKLTILTALREADDALISFNNRQQQFNLLTQSVESNQAAVRIAKERYASGTIGYLSLLDAQRSLLMTQDSMAVSRGEVTLSMVALYKAIGGGWEKIEHDQSAALAVSRK